jgi:hypothetical protein
MRLARLELQFFDFGISFKNKIIKKVDLKKFLKKKNDHLFWSFEIISFIKP